MRPRRQPHVLYIHSHPQTHSPISPMGRQQQQQDPTILHSSITLLQERFRQLQRVKETREERALLRMTAKAESPAASARCEPTGWFIHPDLIRPSRPLHGPPSLGLQPCDDFMDFQALETQLSIGLQPDRSRAPSKDSDETGVDTSLHL